MKTLNRLLTGTFALCFALNATEPDAATKRWWAYTQALANDGMQGRDTGSDGYNRAAAYVIQQFEKAGLKPAGTDGFRQAVPMRSLKLNAAGSSIAIGGKKLAWFRQITVAVRADLPSEIRAPLYFVGDPSTADATKIKGAVVILLGIPRIRPAGSPAPAKLPAEPIATVSIDSLAGPEPPIWPMSYAATVTLAETPTPPTAANAPIAFRVNPDEAETLFKASGHTFAELKKLAAGGETLPNFALPGEFQATLKIDQQNLTSDNIIGILPGSDSALAREFVVLSAHLDGYGLGEPRHGDGIYNGAFDDAAYVALLMDLAQSLHDSGAKLKRSLLFCIVTGEEKGLLGSRYYAAHPTVPKEQLVADLNLDQVRPLFPLKTLTTLALHESTLGDTVQEVAHKFDIRIQPDPEPERNLLRRSDHFSFMQIGVPAVNFVFGYEKGSADEKVYRQWYAERYHSPADDLNQPWDLGAATKFNAFYSALVEAVANDNKRPSWLPGSSFATH